MILRILGTPVAKQSFKTFKGKDGQFHGYPDPNVVQYRDSVKGQILTQLPENWRMIDGPIRINSLLFVFAYLKTFNKTLMDFVLNSADCYIGKPNKPDCDNLLKSIGDCFNKIVWRDDAQIVEINHVQKVYGYPMIIIDFEEITNLSGKYPLLPKWNPYDEKEIIEGFPWDKRDVKQRDLFGGKQ